MRAFLETYGVAIFTLVLMAILIAFASPIGRIVRTAINTQIENIDTIANERIQNPDRPEEPKTAQDYVYARLYNNGEFVLSANEIVNKENVKRDFGKVELQNEIPIWNENASDVLSVRFETAIKPTTCFYWFADMGNLTNIKNLENLYTDKSDSMKQMFYECGSLVHIDTTHFDTRNVTNLSSFNTSNVTSMKKMFANSTNLKAITVSSSWNTSKADTSQMFENCGINHVSIK